MSVPCAFTGSGESMGTVRKTGRLGISLKEASSSRSVRVPRGKESEQTHGGGEGAGLHSWGRGCPGKCEFQGWARNWRGEPGGDCSPQTARILPPQSLRFALKALEPMG